ncbi:mannose-binding lectin, partial [Stereum hirsutum FP-91666 SS1]|uniref:mannose-binding lectin n=1 Tax=Stereum hirsutum (strain FP-91666) TaxID=721885 RepID=UPI000440A10B
FLTTGLPEILNGNGETDKTTNTMLIGEILTQYTYDVVHVQEDFNYHATLYEYDTHPYRTATSGGVPFGSGLNTLSNYDWIDFSRTKWGECSDASENDCLTPKGFTFMRVRLEEGVYVDFVNLHADAGIEEGDEEARTANIQQVADYIATWSIGNPIVIMGDTNSRYTRAEDNIPTIVSEGGLTDAWVEFAENGVPPAAGSDALICADDTIATSITQCEIVDKVLYRASTNINLVATGFYYDTDRFVNSTGGVLTDHQAVRVEFAWTWGTYRQSDLYGGPHGTWFNDVGSLPSNPALSSITLHGGNRLDAVSFTLKDGTVLTHGGSGGDASSLTLASDEYVISAKLCWGKYNDETRNFYAQLTTSTGKTVTTGVETDDCGTASAPDGYGIVGMYGQDGDEMDQLGWIYASI